MGSEEGRVGAGLGLSTAAGLLGAGAEGVDGEGALGGSGPGEQCEEGQRGRDRAGGSEIHRRPPRSGGGLWCPLAAAFL